MHTAAITEWLSAHTTVTPPLAARLLAGGRSNLSYQLSDAAGR